MHITIDGFCLPIWLESVNENEIEAEKKFLVKTHMTIRKISFIFTMCLSVVCVCVLDKHGIWNRIHTPVDRFAFANYTKPHYQFTCYRCIHHEIYTNRNTFQLVRYVADRFLIIGLKVSTYQKSRSLKPSRTVNVYLIIRGK